MKSIKNLVFLGMMGSGKTTIGSMVSKKLKINFFDMDQEIEKKIGIPISEIFRTKGEKVFRQIEEKITLENLQKNRSVISLGGGAFMNSKIQNEILSKHISIWLKWDTAILIKRIQNSKKRPLVYKSNEEEIKNMIKLRSKFYSKALYKLNCDNLTKSEIVTKVTKLYETDNFKSKN
jgi:shikimate kinase/shikimate kinase/3-dehydroquinate synthase